MQGRATSTTLVRTWIPQRTLLTDIGLVIGFSLLTALMAKIAIPLPFTPVPITGQTFAVLAYILEGSVGLPVFARATPASYGYLAGFVAAAFIVGWLAERGWSRDVLRSILAMIAGEVAIYVFGLAWLSRYVGWGQVLALGLFPFLIGDAVKLIAAALIVPAGWRIRER
jgi:biotin transport system substrate-specific component